MARLWPPRVCPHHSRRFWHATHDCVAPYVDIILHRGRFWAKSAASGSVRWLCFRSCWMALSHVMRGRPSCLLQSAGGEATRINFTQEECTYSWGSKHQWHRWCGERWPPAPAAGDRHCHCIKPPLLLCSGRLDTCNQGSRIRSVRILFFEGYEHTLTYSILALRT